MKVVVGASSFATDSKKALELLEANEVQVVPNPYGRRMTQEEIIQHLQGADGLLAGLELLNEEVFSACPQLKAIARIGIGMDNVDIEAARRHHIRVSNTPDGPTQAVAEMTLAALLAIAHQIIPSNEDLHQEVWKKRMGFSIQGAKVLLVGYGRIGRRTGELLQSLGAEILIYDKFQPQVCTCTLEEGLAVADVISLHASGTSPILTRAEFEICKSGVVVLNSARGGLIEEEAIFEALKNGSVSWYWGDALWEEPYHGKLLSCSNAVLTPHICTYTTCCREEMELAAVKNLLEDLNIVPNRA